MLLQGHAPHIIADILRTLFTSPVYWQPVILTSCACKGMPKKGHAPLHPPHCTPHIPPHPPISPPPPLQLPMCPPARVRIVVPKEVKGRNEKEKE